MQSYKRSIDHAAHKKQIALDQKKRKVVGEVVARSRDELLTLAIDSRINELVGKAKAKAQPKQAASSEKSVRYVNHAVAVYHRANDTGLSADDVAPKKGKRQGEDSERVWQERQAQQWQQQQQQGEREGRQRQRPNQVPRLPRRWGRLEKWERSRQFTASSLKQRTTAPFLKCVAGLPLQDISLMLSCGKGEQGVYIFDPVLRTATIPKAW